MQINDGFTVIVILESLFVTSNVLSDISVQVDLSILRENSTDLISFAYKEIHWSSIAIICLLKFLTFVSLVLIGFICRNKREHLKIWIFLGLFFDVILKGVWLGLLLSYHNDVDIPPWEFVAFFSALIFFRGYIYTVSWMTYKELSKGSDFLGYGQGFIYLFHYYKNEFRRVAQILLTVELMWNFRTMIEGDLPAEMNMILMGLEGNITHFIPEVLVLRGFRILVSSIALYFVSSELKSCLLFCWLPFKILTMCWSILYTVYGNEYLTLYGNGFNTVVYYLMIITSLGFRSLVIYYVVRFIFVKYNVPVPLHTT